MSFLSPADPSRSQFLDTMSPLGSMVRATDSRLLRVLLLVSIGLLSALALVVVLSGLSGVQSPSRGLFLSADWRAWSFGVFACLVLIQALLAFVAWRALGVQPRAEFSDLTADYTALGCDPMDRVAEALSVTLGDLHPSCLQRLQHLMNTNIVGVATVREERVELMNDAMLSVLGITTAQLADPSSEVTLENLLRRVFLDPIPLQGLRSTGLSPRTEVEITNLTGETKTLAMMGSRLSETPFRWALIVNDISDQKAREQKLRDALLELNHRSKNLLMVVQSMARMSFKTARSKDEFLASFTARLQGLGASQDVIFAEQGKGADLRDLLRSQIAHLDNLNPSRIDCEGPPVVVSYRAAQAIGMAVHELSTNAAKYGALRNDGGKVSIRWAYKASDALPLSLHWTERDGPRVEQPTVKGFGSSVIARLTAAAVQGTVDYTFRPEGVEWVLRVPSSAILGVDGHAAVTRASKLAA